MSANEKSNAASTSKLQSTDPSTFSFILAVLVVGSSAGMTLYTRRAGSMLNQMKQIEKNQVLRNPPKFGPPTRAEWEKMRPRHSLDD